MLRESADWHGARLPPTLTGAQGVAEEEEDSAPAAERRAARAEEEARFVPEPDERDPAAEESRFFDADPVDWTLESYLDHCRKTLGVYEFYACEFNSYKQRYISTLNTRRKDWTDAGQKALAKAAAAAVPKPDTVRQLEISFQANQKTRRDRIKAWDYIEATVDSSLKDLTNCQKTDDSCGSATKKRKSAASSENSDASSSMVKTTSTLLPTSPAIMVMSNEQVAQLAAGIVNPLVAREAEIVREAREREKMLFERLLRERDEKSKLADEKSKLALDSQALAHAYETDLGRLSVRYKLELVAAKVKWAYDLHGRIAPTTTTDVFKAIRQEYFRSYVQNMPTPAYYICQAVDAMKRAQNIGVNVIFTVLETLFPRISGNAHFSSTDVLDRSMFTDPKEFLLLRELFHSCGIPYKEASHPLQQLAQAATSNATEADDRSGAGKIKTEAGCRRGG